MKCEVFEQRLNQLLDNRKEPETDRTLRVHADNCEDCRQTLVAQELLWEGLDLFEPPELRNEFSKQVVESVFPQQRRRSLVIVTWVAAIAAALLIAIIPVIRGLTTPRDPKPGAPVAGKEPLAPDTNLDDKQPPDLPFDEYDFQNLLPEAKKIFESMGSYNLASVLPIKSTFSSAFMLIRGTIPGGKRDDAKKSDSSFVRPSGVKPVA